MAMEAPRTLATAKMGDRVAAVNGHLSVGSTTFGWGDFERWVPPTRHYYYPTTNYVERKANPTEAAFKVAAMLLEKGIVGDLTLKQFVALVNDIAGVL